MLRFISLSSGSCGNCYYLGTEKEGIIIDAGVSLRKMKKVFQENNINMDTVMGIFVTHDHLDHIRFLGSYCKKLLKPVYATEAVHAALAKHTFTSQSIGLCRKVLNGEIVLGGITVSSFEVPHDATQTVGYAVSIGGYKFVIMTDLGRITDEAVALAREADALVIESNYDVDMLITGPYTKELKMRIMQGHGHMSNEDCASALRRIWHPGLRNIFLCHLSQNNNTPQNAFRCASMALSEIGAEDCMLTCLPRTEPSEIFTLI